MKRILQVFTCLFTCAFVLSAAAVTASGTPRVADTIDLKSGAALDGPIPVALDSGTGRVFIGGYDSGNIIRYNPETGKADGEINGFGNPEHIICGSGRLYFDAKGDTFSRGIFTYDADTLVRLDVTPVPDCYVYSMALDAEAGRLYFGGYSCVRKLDADIPGSTPVMFTDLREVLGYHAFPTAVTVDRPGNRVYITACYYDASDWSFNSSVLSCDIESGEVKSSLYIGRDVFSFDAVLEGSRLFVANMYGNSISVVDVEKNVLIRTIEDVSWPQKLALNTDAGRIYAVDNFSDKFHVIDTRALARVKSLTPGDDPSGVCFDPVRERAYTANHWSDDLGIVDTLSETLEKRVSFAPVTPFDMVLDGNGKAYVTNGPNAGISVVDTGKRLLIDRIMPLAYSDNGMFTFASGMLNIYTGQAVLSGDTLYALDDFNKSVAMFDVGQRRFTGHITCGEVVSGIARDNGNIYYTYSAAGRMLMGSRIEGYVSESEMGESSMPGGIGINAATGRAYAADSENDRILVADAVTGAVLNEIRVESCPKGIAVNSRNNMIYVSNFMSDSIGVIDGEKDELLGYIAAGSRPEGIEVNPLTGRVYAVNSGENSVSVISGYTNAVEAVLQAGEGARYCAFDGASNMLYVPNTADGTITVIEDPPDKEAPVIAHEPVEGPLATGAVCSAVCTVTDESAVAAVNLHYRCNGISSGEWVTVGMSAKTGVIYNGSMPGCGEGITAIEYYISAYDSWGNYSETGHHVIDIEEAAEGSASAVIKIPFDGKRIRGNAVTVFARATENTASVLFQYAFTGNGSGSREYTDSWTDISADGKKPYHVYWNTSALPNGEYRLRAVAYDLAGLPDPGPLFITVYIDDVNADITEDGNPDVDPNSPHRLEQSVKPGSDVTVVTADGTGAHIPRGATCAATTIVIETIEGRYVPVPAEGSVLRPVGVYRKYEMSDGTELFGRDITLSLPYPDEDGDGLVDGTAAETEELIVMYLDEEAGRWVEVPGLRGIASAGTGLPVTGNTVSVKVNHFTIFGLFYRRSSVSLGDILVYPNPCRVYSGGACITFDGLTGSARVNIYTISGRHVREIVSAAGGTAEWDLLSGSGAEVKSGVYVYTVSNPAGERVTGKIAVLR